MHPGSLINTPIQSNPSLPIDLKKEPDGDSTQQNHNDMQKEPTDSLYQVTKVMYRK